MKNKKNTPRLATLMYNAYMSWQARGVDAVIRRVYKFCDKRFKSMHNAKEPLLRTRLTYLSVRDKWANVVLQS